MEDQALGKLAEEELRSLRAYCLGDVSPAQAEAMAERCFVDDEYFAAYEAVKEQLIFDYLHERCSATERQQFERAFLQHPESYLEVQLLAELEHTSLPARQLETANSHAAQVAPAAAIAATSRPASSVGWFSRTVCLPRWQWGLAMLSVLCVFGVAWWIWQARQASEVGSNPNETTLVINQPLASESAARDASALPSGAVTATPVSVRPTPVQLTRKTRIVTLRLLVEAAHLSAPYQATLQREGDLTPPQSLGNQLLATPFNATQATVAITLDLTLTPLLPGIHRLYLRRDTSLYSYRLNVQCQNCAF